MSQQYYVACDLGAESGRVMLGTVGNYQLEIEEIHRFPNDILRVQNSMRWDLLRTFEELKKGLAAIAKRGIKPRSLSVDSWGVDYTLFGDGQPMLSPPRHYRDERNFAAMSEVLESIPKEDIFAATGLQFMPFNTIYQLAADWKESQRLIQLADRFVLVGDYMNYLFSGVATAERSLASTTQLYSPAEHDWAWQLIDRLGLPRHLFPRLVDSGATLGTLLPEVAASTGLDGVQVVASCSHDTGAAVAAIPARQNENWAYLSSGTWSLIGIELDQPLINPQVMKANFTNEVGYGRTVRFLKNIVGLWIVQECRRQWEIEGAAYTYPELTRLAGEAQPLRSLIDPGDERFIGPGQMPDKVQAFCRETGQPIPETPGQIVRCVLESLALLYKVSLSKIIELTGHRIDTLYIVGGGSKNQHLNQFAANATGLEIIAGPAEATAFGNILVQTLTDRQLASIWEAREKVRASTPLQRFHPEEQERWSEAFDQFQSLLRTSSQTA